MKRKSTNFKGITLIETILYLGIAVFIMGAFFSYGWDIAGLSVKSSVALKTSMAAQDISQRINYEIRRAQRVSEISDQRLVLSGGYGDVTFEFNDNVVTIKRNSEEAVTLVADNVKIKDFLFIHQDGDSGQVQYVGFSFTADADYSNSSGQARYQYSMPVQSGATLRLNT